MVWESDEAKSFLHSHLLFLLNKDVAFDDKE